MSGIIVTGRACYQWIACCFTAAVARIPDAQDANATKQRTVAYLSGRGKGNRCFCRRELITIVTPLSRPGSAKTAASVCLYSVYKGKVFPYSLPSVGPGADPGVQAVSPQVT